VAKDLVLEIGTEEIPASYIPPALEQMAKQTAEALKRERLAHGKIRTAGTPRRLVTIIEGLAERQDDVSVEVVGPPKARAFDSDGRPTQAAVGFAKGQGVDLSALRVKSLPKGEYIFAVVEHRGRKAGEILGHLFPEIVLGLVFPKTMRWQSEPFRFARPIRWVLALLGDDVLDLTVAGLRAGRTTYGHRFLSEGAIEVKSARDYAAALERSRVLLDPEVRRGRIRDEIRELAAARGGKVHRDEELLDEVLYLVEYPTAVCGEFDRTFLDLPAEVVITAMKEHQKYFAVEGPDGGLHPFFIAVGNSAPEAADEVRRGNERVLEARLDDARFYWQEDIRTTLEEKVESLSKVVWQEKLGTVLEKTERLVALTRDLAAEMAPESLETAVRAARLCKADLVTEMIRDGKEFTKLQGIMGREYAKVSGEPDAVAVAIAEHYLPRYAEDQIAETNAGAIVGIADKIDTIVGCFGAGLIPSGSQDPYGLRRQGLGLVRTVVEKKFRLNLSNLIARAREFYGPKLGADAAVDGPVLAFFRTRLETYIGEFGFRHDEIAAVLSLYCDDPLDSLARVEALRDFREDREFQGLILGFKRVRNIIKGVGELPDLQKGLLAEESEKKLHASVLTTERSIGPLLQERDYTKALKLLVMLRARIDDLFDRVMVMVEDTALRNNRLALLREVENLFLRVADFSRIVIEGEAGEK
jgi:glycyl-tRNA synthetase beta chain